MISSLQVPSLSLMMLQYVGGGGGAAGARAPPRSPHRPRSGIDPSYPAHHARPSADNWFGRRATREHSHTSRPHTLFPRAAAILAGAWVSYARWTALDPS